MNRKSTPSTLLFLLLLFSALCGPLPAEAKAPQRGRALRELRNYVRQLERDSLMRTTSWSLVVRDVGSGKVLAEHRGGVSLAGASTTKLLTTGAALVALGGDYRYRTQLSYSGTVADSTLFGTLYVTGGGDPSLGSDYEAFLPSPDSLFAVWKRALNQAGIARIEGRMVADSRFFTPEPAVDSWSWSDLDTYYGTAMSGLSFFENKLWLTFRPAQASGEPAELVSVYPCVPGLRVVNRTTTVPGRSDGLRLSVSPLHPLEQFVEGSLGMERGSVRETGANRAAGLSLLCELARRLSCGGEPSQVEYVSWDSFRADADTAALRTPVLVYESAPLRTIASVTNKYSDNMYAETLLRTLGKELAQDDSRAASRRVLYAVLDSIAPGSRSLNMRDGSGLSRSAFLNANYYTEFLVGMARTGAFDDFLSSLAVPGGEGTFRNTLSDCPTRTNLHLKSGSLSGVRAMAGYSCNGDETICFMMMVNRFHSVGPVNDRFNALLEILSRF